MESFQGKVVEYTLPLGEHRVKMNELLGTAVRMEYTGHIHCIKCGRATGKSFAQGYCYRCFISAPETEECVLRPELCRAHEGMARDMEYAACHCLIDHIVYLSETSGIKVGVTRSTQIPTRWIDQGAVRALTLARTPNRFTAGLIEVALKKHIADKTNWRKMVSGSAPGSIDLLKEKHRLSALIPSELAIYLTKDIQEIELEYPVIQYPEKVRSLNFDKDPVVSGELTGIKGQYLMLDRNLVINMRKFGGYQVRFRSGL
ncbi:MAG: DUF2797 domain-containing protein [Bacteroidales bacterium]|nr:DUF2797 domain-containing protein [Bacteroidales bacterium]